MVRGWEPLPGPDRAICEGYKSEYSMPPNKEASRLSPTAGLICLPPISEEIQLVWTQAAQTSELDSNEHLLQTFSYFPYPSLADIALLCLRYGLQMEKVKTWFMAQRLRCGISWSSEEIEETRARVVYHRDQLHFKSLLAFTHHAGRPPEEASPMPTEQLGLGIGPLTLSEPTQMKGLKVEPEESSQILPLPLSHQKAKEPLMTPGSGAFLHQSDILQDLQSCGLSKEQACRAPEQSAGIGSASWNNSTTVHQPHAQIKPKPISILASSCKEESTSSVTPSSSTSSSSFQVLANGATATSKSLQPLGCISQSLSLSEQGQPSHLEPAWSHGLRPNSAAGRGGITEYLSPDMQRQRKTKRKTKEQLAILKSFFLQCQWARREDYHKLEQITGLPRPEIIQWFGDTRYALKHGQLKWFRDNVVPGAPSFQDPMIPTPPSTRSLKEWAETPPLPTPPPPPDIRPLEKYWEAHQQLQEADIIKLSQASRLSTQQVLDWFDSRLPEPAEVVVCLDEEEEEEEEELPEEDEEEEEEEEDGDDDDDDVIIQD
ncbi:homeobox and leucine zipper protein Homez isoform X1 [Dipodomys spectabilis]|uniref:homeobox and leucine zipper protein Homez isoform X1 n=2 Tax=Dipodomys spectabilis TaxID=105255 RepID=UPI001C54654B|nr:homeobox and leucine zipper protein Homez isoform X1 [Dipodomys spectabilis]